MASYKEVTDWILDIFNFKHFLFVLQVMSVKAIGIAIKLTLEGSSQVARYETWIFVTVAVTCMVTQLNYLNKVGRPCSLHFGFEISYNLIKEFLNLIGRNS